MSETNITVKAKIEWSENGYVTAKMDKAEKDVNGFVPVAVLSQILKVGTWEMLNRQGTDCGYDKTKFNLVVIDHNDNDKEHEYTGRIDLGTDTQDYMHVVQDHIIGWLEYCMSDKADVYSKFSIEQSIEALQWCIWMSTSKRETIDADLALIH